MKEGRKGPPRATSRPGSPCGPCYASRRPPLIPSAPSRTLPPLPSSSRSLSSPSVYINLGRLHLYLMLPISSLILLPPPPSRVLRPCPTFGDCTWHSLLAERPTTRPSRGVYDTPLLRFTRSTPAEGVDLSSPLVMDSHDIVRHRRLSCKMAENLGFLKDPATPTLRFLGSRFFADRGLSAAWD